MPNELLTTLNVNIFELPLVDQHVLSEGDYLTLGDLHGNAMKLLYTLVKQGIARNVSHADYQRLVQIYKTVELDKSHIDEFNLLLDKITFCCAGTIRLIGDELADRGNNDYFTLKILEKLQVNQVNFEILLSNHNFDFIYSYEKNNTFSSVFISDCTPSMDNLERLIQRRVISRQDILMMVNRVYKPALRALSYSLSYDKEEISIFSHAGIGLNSLRLLAQVSGVEYKDDSITALAHTIDKINLFFRRAVINHTVHTLSSVIEYTDEPYQFIMWNRDYARLQRPAQHHGYKLNYIHGHDVNDTSNTYIFNLDNVLGKQEDQFRGDYQILYSHGQLKLIHEEKIEETPQFPAPISLVERMFKSTIMESTHDERISALQGFIDDYAHPARTWNRIFSQTVIETALQNEDANQTINMVVGFLELQEILWQRKDFVGLIPLGHECYPPQLLVESAVRILTLAEEDCVNDDEAAKMRANTRISLIAFLPVSLYKHIFSHPHLTKWKTEFNPNAAEVFGRLFSCLDHQLARGASRKLEIVNNFLSPEHKSTQIVSKFLTFWNAGHIPRRSINDIEQFLDQMSSTEIDVNLWHFLVLLNGIGQPRAVQTDEDYHPLFHDPRFDVFRIIESPAVLQLISKTMKYMDKRALRTSVRASSELVEIYRRHKLNLPNIFIQASYINNHIKKMDVSIQDKLYEVFSLFQSDQNPENLKLHLKTIFTINEGLDVRTSFQLISLMAMLLVGVNVEMDSTAFVTYIDSSACTLRCPEVINAALRIKLDHQEKSASNGLHRGFFSERDENRHTTPMAVFKPL